jgi:hypothetical protein
MPWVVVIEPIAVKGTRCLQNYSEFSINGRGGSVSSSLQEIIKDGVGTH